MKTLMIDIPQIKMKVRVISCLKNHQGALMAGQAVIHVMAILAPIRGIPIENPGEELKLLMGFDFDSHRRSRKRKNRSRNVCRYIRRSSKGAMEKQTPVFCHGKFTIKTVHAGKNGKLFF